MARIPKSCLFEVGAALRCEMHAAQEIQGLRGQILLFHSRFKLIEIVVWSVCAQKASGFIGKIASARLFWVFGAPCYFFPRLEGAPGRNINYV